MLLSRLQVFVYVLYQNAPLYPNSHVLQLHLMLIHPIPLITLIFYQALHFLHFIHFHSFKYIYNLYKIKPIKWDLCYKSIQYYFWDQFLNFPIFNFSKYIKWLKKTIYLVLLNKYHLMGKWMTITFQWMLRKSKYPQIKNNCRI